MENELRGRFSRRNGKSLTEIAGQETNPTQKKRLGRLRAGLRLDADLVRQLDELPSSIFLRDLKNRWTHIHPWKEASERATVFSDFRAGNQPCFLPPM
jgi:hypothetical protein